MTDNIKLPPMADDIYDISGPIWRHIVKWSSAEPGQAGSDAADAIDAAITRVMHDYAREAVRLNAQAAPDGWREFIQRVSVQKPEKPDYWSACGQCERNASDAEDLLSAAPAAPQPAQQPLTDAQANCWCESCDLAKGDPCGRTRMSICPNCGDKRCPQAKHHDNECQQAHGIGVKND